jgi:hypothetical protein
MNMPPDEMLVVNPDRAISSPRFQNRTERRFLWRVSSLRSDDIKSLLSGLDAARPKKMAATHNVT